VASEGLDVFALVDLGNYFLILLRKISEIVLLGQFLPALEQNFDEFVLDSKHAVDEVSIPIDPLAEEIGETVEGNAEAKLVGAVAAAGARVLVTYEGDRTIRIGAHSADGVPLRAVKLGFGNAESIEHGREVLISENL
jgi:hypothetical protein